MDKNPVKLSSDEIAAIHALVSSPVFKTFEKIMNHEIESCYGRMATEPNSTELYRLQGRIAGARALMQIPKIIAHNESVRRRDKNKEIELPK